MHPMTAKSGNQAAKILNIRDLFGNHSCTKFARIKFPSTWHEPNGDCMRPLKVNYERMTRAERRLHATIENTIMNA